MATALALALAAVAGCGIPRDPDGTLDRVEGGTLRVGAAANPPWITLGPAEGDEPTGVEAELVRRFARDLGARVEWVEGAEADQFAALHEGELDVVVGGFTTDSPWRAKAALTYPYVTTELVIAIPAGASVPGVDGLTVAVEAGTAAAALVAAEGAVAVPVTDLDGTAATESAAVAIESWRLAERGLQPYVGLATERHVMAAPLGENAFLVRLERFLVADPDEARRLLEATP